MEINELSIYLASLSNQFEECMGCFTVAIYLIDLRQREQLDSLQLQCHQVTIDTLRDSMLSRIEGLATQMIKVVDILKPYGSDNNEISSTPNEPKN